MWGLFIFWIIRLGKTSVNATEPADMSTIYLSLFIVKASNLSLLYIFLFFILCWTLFYKSLFYLFLFSVAVVVFVLTSQHLMTLRFHRMRADFWIAYIWAPLCSDGIYWRFNPIKPFVSYLYKYQIKMRKNCLKRFIFSKCYGKIFLHLKLTLFEQKVAKNTQCFTLRHHLNLLPS